VDCRLGAGRSWVGQSLTARECLGMGCLWGQVWYVGGPLILIGYVLGRTVAVSSSVPGGSDTSLREEPESRLRRLVLGSLFGAVSLGSGWEVRKS
jgi:hypothetical protein